MQHAGHHDQRKEQQPEPRLLPLPDGVCDRREREGQPKQCKRCRWREDSLQGNAEGQPYGRPERRIKDPAAIDHGGGEVLWTVAVERR